MSALNYQASLKSVLIHEGGKVDHPKDPGGRTAYGITQRVYDGYRRANKLKTRDVWSITDAERDAIYRLQYWDAVKGDRLPPGIDVVIFDGAVNSGPGQAVKWLQRALGTVKVDGVIGEATIGAVLAHPNHDALVQAIIAQRMKFLKALETWKTFGKGWTRRLAGVEQLGLSWASGGTIPAPFLSFVSGGDAKALEADLQKAPSQLVGAVLAAAGTAGVTLPQIVDQAVKIGEQLPVLTNAINEAKGGLLQIVTYLPAVQVVIDHLNTAGAVLAVVGLVYATYGKLRKAFLDDAASAQPA